MKRAILIVLAAALMAGASACGHEPVAAKADYFPTAARTRWRYLDTFIMESKAYGADTSSYVIENDTTVDGKRYALLTLILDWGQRYQWGIRKENGNYYSLQLGLYRRPRERLFLKDNLPAGSRWEEPSEDGQSKTVYTITARPAEKRIRGKVYRDVIEVQEETLVKGADDQFVRHYLVKHCYAGNVGRIYAYYPYPSFLTYGDQELELLEYTPD